jgi:hypothetical protein
MALAAAFHDLVVRLRHVAECLQAVQVTVAEDVPASPETVLADQFGNSTLDIRGLLAEAIGAAEEAESQVRDIDRCRCALANCQLGFHQIVRRFASELVSYERLADLSGLGRERRGEWLAWTGSVKQAIEECRHPLDQAADALFECWQEIAERAGMTSVSVRTTNVGQHFRGAGKLAHKGVSKGVS